LQHIQHKVNAKMTQEKQWI